MANSNSVEHPLLSGSGVILSGKLLHIPGYSLFKTLGCGYNATVFLAKDELLGREVAVKIWNGRGVRRARSETAKIASFHHAHVVQTYHFGWVEDHPYCVMEYVPGESGKEWLKNGPSLEERLLVWKIYSTTLRFIHDSGQIHGDAHIGNLLICRNHIEQISDFHSLPSMRITAKLADAGTSEFWSCHAKIEARESDVILETAGRLFEAEEFSSLWSHPERISHQDALRILDYLVDYINVVHYWGNQGSENRNRVTVLIVDLLVDCPFFNLDLVLSQVKRTGATKVSRLAKKFNARMLGISELDACGEEFDRRAVSLYLDARSCVTMRLQKRGAVGQGRLGHPNESSK